MKSRASQLVRISFEFECIPVGDTAWNTPELVDVPQLPGFVRVGQVMARRCRDEGVRKLRNPVKRTVAAPLVAVPQLFDRVRNDISVITA